MTASRERVLALSLAPLLLARERRTTRALLKAERYTLRTSRAAVDSVLARAALGLLGKEVDPRDAMVTVRRTVPSLRDALERALLEARVHARRVGGESLGVPRRREAAHEEDAAASHTTASSYAAAWGAAAMAAILSSSEKARGSANSQSLAPSISPAPLDFRLRRIAATETARAFNDERVATMRAHHEPAAGVFKVWSAVLDRRTCGDCFDRDGRTIELHDSFGASPPLHVCCRCVLEFLNVPLPERLEDIAFDYARFKLEMRDVIRERRAESARHAGAFVRGSMGRDRSPVVLTRKFRALAH